MVVLEIGVVFMQDFRFDTIYNITQEPHKLQRYNCHLVVHRQICCDKIIYYQLLSKVKLLKGKSRFDQLVAASIPLFKLVWMPPKYEECLVV